MTRAGARSVWLRAAALALALAALALYLAARRVATAAPPRHVAAVPYSPAVARLLPEDAVLAQAIARAVAERSLRRGQTLSEVFDGLGLTPVEADELAGALAAHADLRKLRPADSYAAVLDGDDRLTEFRLTLAGRGRVTARRSPEGVWSADWREFTRSSRVRRVAGVLEGSLEDSIRRAGGSPMLAYEMAEILQWDLDFYRDLRLEDRFELIYEELFLDGAFEAIGAVLALRYVNDGRPLEAYRFGEPPGYYDGEGRPLRKLFLRSPLRYSRVTSRFSARRFHPVLKRYRPHYGVDYGAPVGTPVRATAGGTVTFAAWDRGGGRTVKVRHPNGFLTAYLHLSRFASGVRPGRRVVQGETIGYVGTSGLSTGPHLDYRVQQHGRWINPLAMKMEPAEPIPEERLGEYLARRDELRRALEGATDESAATDDALLATLPRVGAPAAPASGS